MHIQKFKVRYKMALYVFKCDRSQHSMRFGKTSYTMLLANERSQLPVTAYGISVCYMSQ